MNNFKMDTEVSQTASVSSIVDSKNETNVQNEAEDSFKSAELFTESECNKSSDDKVTQIVPDTKTESLIISAKAIEVVELTDLSEKLKSTSNENTSIENIIDVEQSERQGKS